MRSDLKVFTDEMAKNEAVFELLKRFIPIPLQDADFST